MTFLRSRVNKVHVVVTNSNQNNNLVKTMRLASKVIFFFERKYYDKILKCLHKIMSLKYQVKTISIS